MMQFKSLTSVLMLALLLYANNTTGTDVKKLASWVALNAPTGHEHLATGPLMQRLDGWSVDRSGNMTKTVGKGNHHRVVACGLDTFSFTVSQITSDGYLRLHHVGQVPKHPLWDQSHEGQQLRILTSSGPLVGVSAIANGHFARQHKNDTSVITADDLWLDVGATSAMGVAAMGIELLDPVVRHLPAWFYANEVAGPGAGARIGCAALVAAAESQISGPGRTTWMLTGQRIFGWVDLAAALPDLAPVHELVLLEQGGSQRRNEQGTGLSRFVDPVLRHAGITAVQILAPQVSDPGALMERIELAEAVDLLDTLVALVDASATRPDWIEAPPVAAVVNTAPGRLADGPEGEALARIENLLDKLAEKSAVPGHEGPVRAIVRAAMPTWAREIAQTDEMGNIWIDMGPADKKATIFIAHMDEVGWEVEAIDQSGVVHLKQLGGVVVSAWEGQPARLQLDAATGKQSLAFSKHLNGIFLSRIDPARKIPDKVDAWFGMDATGLHAAGVRVGMGVTGYKQGHRMGRYRYACRGLDDRVGTTALLLALQELEADKLQHRLIFAWSVREESGLVGATALAERYGSMTRRVYSVDTFVSSDTPLESPHFAYTPLGAGPVLRSIESRGMVKPHELRRNRSIASAAGIRFQIGMTQGATDGTVFTFWGAPNAGLSWPGRYSHSPAEIADLRDLAGLVKLIHSIAVASP